MKNNTQKTRITVIALLCSVFLLLILFNIAPTAFDRDAGRFDNTNPTNQSDENLNPQDFIDCILPKKINDINQEIVISNSIISNYKNEKRINQPPSTVLEINELLTQLSSAYSSLLSVKSAIKSPEISNRLNEQLDYLKNEIIYLLNVKSRMLEESE